MSSRAKIIGAGVGFSLLLGGAAWAWYARTDPQLAKVRELGEQLWQQRDNNNVSREDRRQQWEAFRTEVEALPPEQRAQLRQEREADFQRSMQERLTAFFKLSPTEQRKELDRQIDEMEKRRKRFQERRNPRDAQGQRSDQPNGPGARGSGAGGPGGGGRDGPGGRGGPQQRNERRRQFLDSTTPELRAMMYQQRQMMAQRRQERGLPPGGGWGGRGGR